MNFLRPSPPNRARVRPGQLIRAEHHNALVNMAERGAIQRGPLKGRRMPDGFIPRVQVDATLSVDYNFRVSLDAGKQDGEFIATFTPGDVGGIVPKVGDLALDDVDPDGNPPQLIVPADAWKQRGNVLRALIMFRYDLDHESFAVVRVTPVAVATPPPVAGWVWHKLVAVLTRQGDDTPQVWQRVFFSQYFDVAGAKPATGAFQPLPHVAS